MVFRGGGGRAGGRSEGQAGQMEDGTQHLGHCMVDMKELSASPEGLTAAGELTALCSPPLPLLRVLPRAVELSDTLTAIRMGSFCRAGAYYL